MIHGVYRLIGDDQESLAIGIRPRWTESVQATALVIANEQAVQVELSSGRADSDKFHALVQEWKSHRSASSTIREITQHPAYQKIIGMGKSAVPLILEQLRLEGDEPAHWFWALHVITLEQPVSRADRGDMVKMARAWLEWGKRNGYVW